MFANDLLQSQLSLGAYSGGMSPYNSPWTASLQTGGTSPFTQQQGYGGIPNYAAIVQQQQIQQQLQHHLQQLQALASLLATQGGNAQIFGGSQPNVLQNPLIAASLQNPLLNPILAQQLGMQQQNPFAQSGFPLAPQSWVGQQIPGQVPHHLQQFAGRGIY